MKLTHVLFGLIVTALSSMTYADTQTVPPAEKSKIEQVVHDYLLKNPEVIIQAVQVLQQKQMSEATKSIAKTQNNAPKFANALFQKPNDPMMGNPKGKVTIVEFFDYQCAHCVEMTPVLESIVQSNSDVGVIFKEFPIRGPVSETASRAALAARIQGKYMELHKAIMNTKERLSEDIIYSLAASIGLNVDQLKKDMKSDQVNQQIKDNYKLAQELGLLGTPAIFVAKVNPSSSTLPTVIEFIPGQTDKAQLQGVIDKVK
jgi:protein-disulfide isomerase